MLGKNLVSINMTTSVGTTIQFKYFFIILTLFTATWLISNIAAVKLVSVFGVTLTGGFIIFPFTTMLSSIIVEVYGYKNARQAIWSGFILNLTFVFFINLVNFVPSSPYWSLGKQFNDILIPETRIIFASLGSFLLSDFSNSYLMSKMKIKNHGKSLAKRILISSGFSIFIDITCFMLMAFSGAMSVSLLTKLMVAAYFKKVFCQILLFPLIWYLIRLLKKTEGVEIYDYDTKFNPFSIDNIYELNSLQKMSIKKQGSDFSSSVLTNG
jgi:hypothetical protein